MTTGKVEMPIPMGREWIDVPPIFFTQEIFDYEHFAHRHSPHFGACKLLERGEDYAVFRFEPRLYRVPLPAFEARLTLLPPWDFEIRTKAGLLGELVARIACTPKWGGSLFEQAHIIELNDSPFARLFRRVFPVFSPMLMKFVRWKTELISQEERPAMLRMARGFEDDELIWYGVRMRFPPGGARARMPRMSTLSIVQGCADCGYHEMGFDLDGVVRCPACDYLALHSGAGHKVEKRGADWTCECVARQWRRASPDEGRLRVHA